MKNILRQIKRKRKRKKAAAQKAARVSLSEAELNGTEDYEMRLARHRKKSLMRLFATVGVVAAAVFLTLFYFEKKTYHDYKVVSSSDQEDTISTQYTELNGKIFRYGPQGASLESQKQEVLWSETYDMQNPVADVCQKTAVVADQGGTSMAVFSEDGLTGTITTSYNIIKAKVAQQGVVAAILDGGEDTWINFYASDGSLIAENQTRVDEPGYPLDIAVSEDGMLIMVSYQFVEGQETTSYVAFYNFGTAGQNQIDNIVSGYQYEGVVVPQIEYLSDSLAVAFRDDGFTIYKGQQVPQEAKTVEVEKEIVSTFHDSEHIGLVFKDEGKDKLYTMEVYDTDGNKVFEESFNIPYTNIKMTDGQIVMFNSSQACIFSSRGSKKFDGTIDDGVVRDLFKVGMNRYVLVMENGVSIIKLT